MSDTIEKKILYAYIDQAKTDLNKKANGQMYKSKEAKEITFTTVELICYMLDQLKEIVRDTNIEQSKQIEK